MVTSLGVDSAGSGLAEREVWQQSEVGVALLVPQFKTEVLSMPHALSLSRSSILGGLGLAGASGNCITSKTTPEMLPLAPTTPSTSAADTWSGWVSIRELPECAIDGDIEAGDIEPIVEARGGPGGAAYTAQSPARLCREGS